MCMLYLMKKFFKKVKIDFTGISLTSLFCGVTLSLASLAASGVNKKLSPPKLDTAFKVAIWLQLVSTVIGSVCVAVFLLSISIVPLKKLLTKFGKAYLVASAAVVLLLEVVALNLYMVMRMTLGDKASADPDLGLWSGLLIAGTVVLGPSLMITMAPKNESTNENVYKELIDP